MPHQISQLNLNFPFGLGGVTVEIIEAERAATWKHYVEFIERISAKPLHPGAGSVRMALAYLTALFVITRETLKVAGPEVGQSPDDLGPVAIRVVDDGPRPFLTKWHVAYGYFELAVGLEMLKEHGLRIIPTEFVD